MKTTVIIVAGGSGTRMKSEIPKQFLMLKGQPILMRTIKQFNAFGHNFNIHLVLPSEQIAYWEQLCKDYNFSVAHKIVEGGQTRFHSVKNGLAGVGTGEYVAVHDGVRPLVSRETIERCLAKVKDSGAVIPVTEVFETIRELQGSKSVTLPRENYRLVQTPQLFKSEILLKAYQQNYTNIFTDDASVVESLGYNVELVEGNRENIKITTPQDLRIAEVLMQEA